MDTNQEALTSKELRELVRFQEDGVYLKEGTSIAFFPWMELLLVLSEDHQTCFVSTVRRIVIRTSLNSLEDELSQHGFIRINRQLIINLRHVKKLTTGPKSKVVLSNGQAYVITRRRRTQVVKAHEEFLVRQSNKHAVRAPLRTVRSRLEDMGTEKLWTPSFSKVRNYLKNHPDITADKRQAFEFLAQNPVCHWLGQWNADLMQDVRPMLMEADAVGEIPVFVLYRLQVREETKHQKPNLIDLMNYKHWIRSLVQAIAHYKCIVILEPNALSMLGDTMPQEIQDTYYEALRFAIANLRLAPHVRIYVDAGHSSWVPAHEMAIRLARVGIDFAHGFALNVSNFIQLDEIYEYGQSISGLLGEKPFVIDTSRNGLGNREVKTWCNPSGVGLGRLPTLRTQLKGVDAFLWVKPPGESDGANEVSGAPRDGEWWPVQAWELIRMAKVSS